MSELLPCAFCGARPEYSERADAHTQTGRIYFISCNCGGYSARAHQYADTYEEVVYLWNTRTHPAEALPEPVAETFVKTVDLGEYDGFKDEIQVRLLKELPPHIKLYTSPDAARVPAVCDGKEQAAFEQFAKAAGLSLEMHPLHYLFLNKNTYFARNVWKAAIEYCNREVSATPPSSAVSDEDKQQC